MSVLLKKPRQRVLMVRADFAERPTLEAIRAIVIIVQMPLCVSPLSLHVFALTLRAPCRYASVGPSSWWRRATLTQIEQNGESLGDAVAFAGQGLDIARRHGLHAEVDYSPWGERITEVQRQDRRRVMYGLLDAVWSVSLTLALDEDTDQGRAGA